MARIGASLEILNPRMRACGQIVWAAAYAAAIRVSTTLRLRRPPMRDRFAGR
jgi:hypothetical protein